MSEKFKNKYRAGSMRLSGWDYRSNAAYFITICTKNRKHFFGEIDSGKMIYNVNGKMAEKYWNEIPEHFPFVELGNFVVMPDHMHGILIIDRGGSRLELESESELESLHCNDCTFSDYTCSDCRANHMSMISPKSGSISVIVRSYKSVVSKNIRLLAPGTDFGWQSYFHDHIIRDAESFERIQNYIADNPKKWKDGLNGEPLTN